MKKTSRKFLMGKALGKYIALFLAAVLTVSLCTCGENGSGSDGKEITQSAQGGHGSSGGENAGGQNTGGTGQGGTGQNGDSQDGAQGGGGGEQAANGSGFRVIIYSRTKADIIIEDAHVIEPGSYTRYKVVCKAKGLDFLVCLEAFGETEELYWEMGTYRYEDGCLIFSVNGGAGGIDIDFYDVSKYELSFYEHGNMDGEPSVFAAADVTTDKGNGGAIEFAADLQAGHCSPTLTYFEVENAPLERDSNDVYQLIFSAGGKTYCAQGGNYTGEEYFQRNEICRAVNAENTEFEPMEYDRWGVTFTVEEDRLLIYVSMEGVEGFDFNEVEEFTLRYLKNNGGDGQAEKVFAAADVRSAPLECFTWEDDGNGGVSITGFKVTYELNGSLTDTYIPRWIDGKPVTTIVHCPAVGNLVVSDSVTKICEGAFMGSDFTGIFIPASVTEVEIGEAAFYSHENLKSLTILGGNAIIGETAFLGYSLTDVNIEVKSIGRQAFRENKNIVNLNVTAEFIGNDAFYECGIENAVIMADIIDLGAFASSGGEPSVKNLTLKEGIKEIGELAFANCGDLVRVTIPGSVEKIGIDAFSGNINLESVVMEEGVKELERGAFWGCTKLAQVSLPSTLTELGASAFDRCESLRNITIPGGVKTVGSHAFFECDGLTTVIIEEGVEVLDNSAFRQIDSEVHFSLPDSLREIRNYVFSHDENMTATYKGKTYNYDTLDALYAAVNGQ